MMAYRKKKGLPFIPLSKSLTYVAKAHVIDLSMNRPFTKKCNMHSWSKNPNWTDCCYTPDHKKGSCMRNKPRELTIYTGNGYEIAFGFTNEEYGGRTVTAELALSGWKSSKGHNAVILNKSAWKSKWNAVGIGMYRDFAVVWFGNEADPDGEPGMCE